MPLHDLSTLSWQIAPTPRLAWDAPLDNPDRLQDWLPARVPGTIQRDLMAAGRLPDLYQVLDLDAVLGWVDAQDWWYRAGLPAILPGQRAWLREVALCLGERSWVVARSVAPLTGLPEQELAHLGERSLGSWLFRQPDLERGEIEATTAPAGFHEASGPWGRRSVFRRGDFRVLVQEWFLDAMADDLGLPSR